MLVNRRVLVAVLLTLVVGLLVINVARDRDFVEALPLVIILLVGLVAAQFGLLFGIGPRTRALNAAQRAFVSGDFETAAQLLEADIMQAQENGEVIPVKSITLLGNTYRQLGRLEDSVELLQQAAEIAPDDPFPLYGLGRTLLVSGQYEEAADAIKRALDHGARKAVRAEWVLAQYYAGMDGSTLLNDALKAGRVLRLQNFRALIVNYVLWQLYQQPDHMNPEQVSLSERVMNNTAHGLAYWEAEAERYQATPYGQRLAQDIETIRNILSDD